MLLGWTEPYVRAILAFLRDRLGLDLRLDAHWKHVTVLMLLFFCAVLRVSRMGGVIIAATFAILLSLGIGILLGTSWTSDATALIVSLVDRRKREEGHWGCRLFIERQFQNRPPLVIDDDGSCLKPHPIC